MGDLRGRGLLVYLTPAAAVLLALLIGGMMLSLLGSNPWAAYKPLFVGAFGNTNALADTIVKATPLLFVGLGICISFRGGVLNIGGEGQLVARAVSATSATMLALAFSHWPGWALIPICLCACRYHCWGDLGRDRWDPKGLFQCQRDLKHDHATVFFVGLSSEGYHPIIRR